MPLLATLSLFGCKSVTSRDAQATTALFSAADGVPVTATIYKKSDSATWIVLCHQAGYSRGEYNEIAPKLVALGFNCIAIDARSGDQVNGVPNQTAQAAHDAKKPTEYLDAKQDIEAAVNYAYGLGKRKVILFGSSYSASLALLLGTTSRAIEAIVAFSPGEYFGDHLNLTRSIQSLSIPTFVTSARKEAGGVTALFHGQAASSVTQFVPNKEGVHGASALWSSTPNNDEYWTALKSFLKPYERPGMLKRLTAKLS